MENIEAMLCAYIEGDLDAAGRAEIEKHLQAHPEHRKLLEELMATRDLVRDLPRVKAPMEVSESLHGHVERSILLDGEQAVRSSRGGKRRWTSMLAIAAVFLLGSGSVLLRLSRLDANLAAAGVYGNRGVAITDGRRCAVSGAAG